MQTPSEKLKQWKTQCKREWITAFLTVIILGLLTHLPVMINDWPNHDGLASLYFDQNMITSGRWFLSVACGISSYFTIPWVIGIFSLVFLGLGAAALVEFLEIRETLWIICVCGLLVTFPALCSTYAYIFTADGYMMALALVFFAVMLTRKYRRGFLAGGICLAFSMGIYQSYLAFAILLSVYGCAEILMKEMTAKNKVKEMLHYLYMGMIGVILYFAVLHILLFLEGKTLASYQGINDMAAGAKQPLIVMLISIYHDFAAFTVKGNVLYNNIFSGVALLILIVGFLVVCIRKHLVLSWKWWAVMIILAGFLPLGTNMILLISPNVTYHLLMRYQWILYPILLVAFILKQTADNVPERALLQWGAFLAAAVLILNYAVTDNIAYSNLSKKYDKTYAYCLRLADRMEQTNGYYTGIPVAMIGVQSKKNYPVTDLTDAVTSNMIGMTGDYLVYTDNNYQAFMKNYLGITINLVSDEKMEQIYKTQEYQALDSFPGNNSMKVVNGVLYIKTE